MRVLLKCTGSILGLKHSSVFSTTPEPTERPEERFALKYSLTSTDRQLSQRTGDRSLSAFVQLFSTPGACSPLSLNFVSMDTELKVNK